MTEESFEALRAQLQNDAERLLAPSDLVAQGEQCKAESDDIRDGVW